MSVDRHVWTSRLLRSPHQASDKAGRIRCMFNGIATRYELVNSVFSLGWDAAWRRRAVELAEIGSDDEVLDVACGTGDFARAFAAAGARKVVGCDFAHEMLVQATRRRNAFTDSRQRTGADSPAISWCEADALRLPFREETFSVVSCAFGVRNFADLGRGLAEMRRVLRPEGRVVILEFTRPNHRLARALYEAYSHYFMPLAATVLSGDRSGAYRYLPRSVVSFLDAAQMMEQLCGAGFDRAKAVPLSKGIVTVYVAFRKTRRSQTLRTD